MPTWPKKKKYTKMCASSHFCILCFWGCSEHKKSPKTLRSIFYKMEHIWWAPSRLKNSPKFNMRSQLSPRALHYIVFLSSPCKLAVLIEIFGFIKIKLLSTSFFKQKGLGLTSHWPQFTSPGSPRGSGWLRPGWGPGRQPGLGLSPSSPALSWSPPTCESWH